ncbi:MAG: hypothetical protein HQL02_06845 [Nitrospirae bacterium]|nr:hypothetical protein [Nitrospirota bacterium]
MTEILDVAHEMAKDLFKVGAMDEVTMRTIDALCLPPKQTAMENAIVDEARHYRENRSMQMILETLWRL